MTEKRYSNQSFKSNWFSLGTKIFGFWCIL